MGEESVLAGNLKRTLKNFDVDSSIKLKLILNRQNWILRMNSYCAMDRLLATDPELMKK